MQELKIFIYFIIILYSSSGLTIPSDLLHYSEIKIATSSFSCFIILKCKVDLGGNLNNVQILFSILFIQKSVKSYLNSKAKICNCL
jgi:hypothetical protein